MKHFRYYSAINIVETLNDYLELKKDNFECLKFENNKSTQVWFSYLGRANKSGPSTLPLFSKTEWLKKLKGSLKNKFKSFLKFKTYDELPQAIKK